MKNHNGNLKIQMLAVFISPAITMTIQPSFACGFCEGDKAASVYSHKNIEFAKKTNSCYVSVELIGPTSEEEYNNALSTLREFKEIYPNTIRGAYAQRSMSFVYQSSVKLEDLNKKLLSKRPHWRMKLIGRLPESDKKSN